MQREEQESEKERRPTGEAKAGVHGKKNESGLGFRGFIQFRGDVVQSKAVLGVAVVALNSVA